MDCRPIMHPPQARARRPSWTRSAHIRLAHSAARPYHSASRTACPLRNGRVAQLVEQGIENPRVGGSIPSPATIRIHDPAKATSRGFCFDAHRFRLMRNNFRMGAIDGRRLSASSYAERCAGRIWRSRLVFAEIGVRRQKCILSATLGMAECRPPHHPTISSKREKALAADLARGAKGRKNLTPKSAITRWHHGWFRRDSVIRPGSPVNAQARMLLSNGIRPSP